MNDHRSPLSRLLPPLALVALSTLSTFTVGGCASRLLDPPDGGAHLDAGASNADGPSSNRDAAASFPDGGGACSTHTLEVARLSNLSALDVALRVHQAFRFLLSIDGSPCDHLGPVDVSVQIGNATDFVGITAHAWRTHSADPACAGTVTMSRVITLDEMAPVSNMRLSVRDMAPGGTVGAIFSVGPPLPGACGNGLAGSPCSSDCQCKGSPDGRCIPSGGRGVCGVPCNGDSDCVSQGLITCGVSQLAPWLCGLGDCHGQPCPLGQACTGVPGGFACHPAQMVQPGLPCACDSDCGYGGVCDGSQCRIPCSSASECPRGIDACSPLQGCVPLEG